MIINRYKTPLLAAFFMTSALAAAAPSYALSGDPKLACEAILCLSSSTRPSECTPSLTKYFSIWDKKPWKIPKKRLNFLQLCPWQGQSDVEKALLASQVDIGKTSKEMNELIRDIAHGAGNCDVKHLNDVNRYTVWVYTDRRTGSTHETTTRPSFEDLNEYTQESRIRNNKPAYCVRYENNILTDLDTAKYVGDPDKGYWIETSKYEAAQAEYEAEKKRKEDESRQRNRWRYQFNNNDSR
ncbi:conjugal transfer protein TrbM [Oligella urethralis]|uniref:TrbM/KikA/MpfK family conjugal transfer protein n=1 Tax=Oligella urethralis TaxID=90245 RepID=UPI000CFE55AD|nr:TrbM/KikA/MpfK family conjugal transfer protein [Oligella urethralis]AVL70616.1 conjugal transfer protein TrbM [Oligella urethralis]